MTDSRKTIFLVDDSNTNLVACKKILKPYYEVYPIPSAVKMLKLIEHIRPDLILLDIEMPEMNGYEAARSLKDNEAYQKIPVIFLSGRGDPVSEQFGMNLGAVDYMHKPVNAEKLLWRLKEFFDSLDDE
jgi:putative two-component system response regulator